MWVKFTLFIIFIILLITGLILLILFLSKKEKFKSKLFSFAGVFLIAISIAGGTSNLIGFLNEKEYVRKNYVKDINTYKFDVDDKDNLGFLYDIDFLDKNLNKDYKPCVSHNFKVRFVVSNSLNFNQEELKTANIANTYFASQFLIQQSLNSNRTAYYLANVENNEVNLKSNYTKENLGGFLIDLIDFDNFLSTISFKDCFTSDYDIKKYKYYDFFMHINAQSLYVEIRAYIELDGYYYLNESINKCEFELRR